MIHDAIGRLSTVEKWLSPRLLNFSLAAFLKVDEFLGKPSLKELGLGLRLPWKSEFDLTAWLLLCLDRDFEDEGIN